MVTKSPRVAIRPRVGVFSVFEAVDYKAWFALAEFVDNAIQSFITMRNMGRKSRNPLTIAIDVGSLEEDYIVIKDDAAGIALNDFARAFEVGSPPPDPSGLSVYGIGMKSAAAWFAQEFTISTTVRGEPVRHVVHFDFPHIVQNLIEELTVTVSPAALSEHGTEITLKKLRHPIQKATHAKVRNHLASIYRNYIRGGDVRLFYRGEPLTYETPEILKAPPFQSPQASPFEWRKEINIELTSGEKLHGFAALRATGRASASGFSLYRNMRVITGLDDDPWRPVEIFGYGNSYRSQRLYGELHVEGVKVAYSKNGFLWRASEEEIIEKLRFALDARPLQLLKQAEGHRSRVLEPRQRAAATRAFEETIKAVNEAMNNELVDRVLDAAETTPPEELPKAASSLSKHEFPVLFQAQWWNIHVELVEDDNQDCIHIADSGVPTETLADIRHIGIRVNVNTDFMRRYAVGSMHDVQGILRIAAALALGVIVCREQGQRYADMLLHQVNKLLAGSLSK